jgi:hypothetical protein
LIKSICGIFLPFSHAAKANNLRATFHLAPLSFKKKVMRILSGLLMIMFVFISCRKEYLPAKQCDIQKVYEENAARVTITKGIWGTVSSMEGNCMPVTDPSTCKHCPVKRTVKIYEYTLLSQAVPSGSSTVFFDNFNTQLLAQADADSYGFFQINIPPGKYTIAVVENGKLNANVVMTYKAVF